MGKVEIGAVMQPDDRDGKSNKEKRIVTAGQAVAVRREAGQPNIDSANFRQVMNTSLAKPFESLARLSTKMVAYGVPNRSAGDQRQFHGGVGLDFDIKFPIRVLGLGVFDHLGDGIDPSTSPVVQLWSRDDCGTPNDRADDIGREILASQTFTTGNARILKQGHRIRPLLRPIELMPGSYTVVAYELSDANPFIQHLPTSLSTGSISILKNREEPSAHIGGIFARKEKECYYGDTKLEKVFTLNDPISASGVFAYANPETMQGKCFIGHFSQSTADNRREFIGLEFGEGEIDPVLSVRARIYRFNGDVEADAYSDSASIPRPEPGYPILFDYDYDPNYEADETHPGPEGRLKVHLYSDDRKFDMTQIAVNQSSHRVAGSTFDAFGIGITTMESFGGDDPASTVELYFDDLKYSGHDEVMDFNVDPHWNGVGNTMGGNHFGWVEQPSKVCATKIRPAIAGSTETSCNHSGRITLRGLQS